MLFSNFFAKKTVNDNEDQVVTFIRNGEVKELVNLLNANPKLTLERIDNNIEVIFDFIPVL
jgi:hypothetical protein